MKSVGREDETLAGDDCARDRGATIATPREAGKEDVQHASLDAEPHRGVNRFHCGEEWSTATVHPTRLPTSGEQRHSSFRSPPRKVDEADAIADVWLRSRAAAAPSIPRPVHTDDEVKEWFATVVLPTREVWVVEQDDGLVALMVLDDGWIDQLYVDPPSARRGLGSQLLDLAKERNPLGLDLWTFQANTAARRFYERHGFVAVATTEGDNEERAPDVRYRWPGAEA